MSQNVCVLGATGSIGKSTLKVLADHPDQYSIYALTAHSRIDRLIELCKLFKPKVVVVPENQYASLKLQLQELQLHQIDILVGETGLIAVASDPNVDIVMAAIVGAAGLMPTLAAIKTGKRVLLANKEALVMSGEIMLEAAAQYNALLLPVDSEHNAIFQCLPYNYPHLQSKGEPQQGVSRILLTASGGPFLNFSNKQLSEVTPEQACKHPNWSMGRKISVDSATLMNKGLELIEACHLFSISEHFVTVVIHPQSIIHSMVQYVDGSTLAQMGNPDMCTPIAHALAWPNRISTQVGALDLFQHSQLNFQPPDTVRFPALNLARFAIQTGGTAPAILNAANEVAVEAFLNRYVSFTDITEIVEQTLNEIEVHAAESIEAVLDADDSARKFAQTRVEAILGA
ncbi:MAG: 1-deoxy-D-xylulose-5-phosphate reductoisomerase [Acinetobacter sp.]